MALVTIRAVVHISTYALVILVSLRLGVTVSASEHQVIPGIGMARRADAVSATVIRGKPGVIKDRP